jgi:hypothetical protein
MSESGEPCKAKYGRWFVLSNLDIPHLPFANCIMMDGAWYFLFLKVFIKILIRDMLPHKN